MSNDESGSFSILFKLTQANTGASCLTTSYNSSRWDNHMLALAGEPEKTHHLDTLTPGHRC